MASTGRHIIVAVEQSASAVGFYDSETWAEAGRVNVGFWPHEIEVSEDEGTIYVTNFGIQDYDETIGRPGASISVIDVASRCEVKRLYTFGEPYEYATRRAPHGVKLGPENQLYVNLEDEFRMLVFDLSNPARVTPVRSFSMAAAADPTESPKAGVLPSYDFPIPHGTHNFLFSKDQRTLFVIAGKGGVVALDPMTGKELYRRSFDSPVRGLVYTPDGELLIASLKNELRLLWPSNLQDFKVLDNEGKGLGVGQILYSKPTVPDASGKYEILAPAVWDSQIVFIDPDTGRTTGRIVTGIDPVNIQLCPDGSRAYVTHGRSPYLSVIDVKNRSLVGQIRTRGGPNGVAVVGYSAPPERGKLVVGACLPLSGAFGAEGREICLGYELWKEHVNGAGGVLVDGRPHEVDIVYRDIGPHPTTSPEIPRLAKELIEQNGAQFLFGTYPSPAHLGAGPDYQGYARVAEEHQVPLITATGAGTEIYEQGYDYVFGIMSPARLYLAGTIEVVRMLVPHERPRVAFLSCQDFAALEDARETARFAVKKGLSVASFSTLPALPEEFRIDMVEAQDDTGQPVKVEILTYPDGHKDYAVVLQQMRMAKEFDLDLFLSTGHVGESVALVKQADEERFTPRGFGLSVGPATTSFHGQLLATGASPEHLFGAAQWTDKVHVVGYDPFVTPDEFGQAFLERFNMKASYLSAGGYACGLVLHEALRQSGTASAQAVQKKIAELKMETFYARIRFNEQGLNDRKPMYAIQLRKSKEKDTEFDQIILWPPQGAVWPKPVSQE